MRPTRLRATAHYYLITAFLNESKVVCFFAVEHFLLRVHTLNRETSSCMRKKKIEK